LLTRTCFDTVTGCTVRGSNSGGRGEIFPIRPDRPWAPPSLLYNRHRLFPGVKAAWAWRWPPTPYCAEVKERVELHFYCPSSWAFMACTRMYFISRCMYTYGNVFAVFQHTQLLVCNYCSQRVWPTLSACTCTVHCQPVHAQYIVSLYMHSTPFLSSKFEV